MTEDDDFDVQLPEGRYLTLRVSGGYEKLPGAWKTLFAYMDTLNLTAAGDPMELYTIDNHDTNDESEYITQLQVPLG